MLYYGLVDEEEAYKYIKVVCDSLGYGKNKNADKLLLETAKAETLLGKAKDTTLTKAGCGLCQFDKEPFEDVKERVMKYRYIILDKMKIDIQIVEYEWLTYNPLLSFLFCRLKYRLIPEEIPTTLEGRARYWKKYYNSILGAGDIYHYLQVNKG